MKRVLVILLALAVLVALGAAGWFATQTDGSGSPVPSASDTSRSADRGTAPDESDSATSAPETDKRRVRRADQPGRAADLPPAAVVSGKVLTRTGEPLSGATVIAYAVVEPGDPGSGRNRARRYLRREFLNSMLDDGDEVVGPAVQEVGPEAGSSSESGSTTTVEVEEGQVSVSVEVTADGDDFENPFEMMSELGSIDDLFAEVRSAVWEILEDSPGSAEAETRSVADGSFVLEGLQSSRVEVRVVLQGFVRRKLLVDLGETDLIVKLQEGTSVSGRVLSEGAAVAGAEVFGGMAHTVSATDGSFRLEAVSGKKDDMLVARAAGYVVGFAKVPSSEEGQPVADVTIELEPGGVIEGVVTTADGGAADGAVVILAGGGSNPMALMSLAMDQQKSMGKILAGPRAVTTDGSGRFRIDGVPSGTRKVEARLEGYLRGRSEKFDVVAGVTTSGADVVLERESVLVGRVTGPDGAPVAKAVISVEKQGPKAQGFESVMAGIFGGGKSTSSTDEDGRYRVAELAAGDVKVRVESDGFLSHSEKLNLPVHEEISLDVTLKLGFTVSGVVVGPDGKPVAEARITVEWPETKDDDDEDGGGGGMMRFAFSGLRRKGAMGDGEGAFTVEGLEPGPYKITAGATNFIETTLEDVAAGRTDVRIELGAAATISGRVVSEADGSPVAGATVSYSTKGTAGSGLFGGSSTGTARTAADGTFTLAGLDTGDLEVWAQMSGYAKSAKMPCSVLVGTTQEGLELVLPPAVTLAGRVVSKTDGRPVEGALVGITDNGSGRMNWDLLEGDGSTGDFDVELIGPGTFGDRTDASGAFTIEGLTPGTVTVYAKASGFAQISVSGVEVPGTGLVVEMPLGGAVEGTVFGKTGKPRVGVDVTVNRGMMDEAGKATTGSDGAYRIDSVAPGQYTLVLMDFEERGFMPQTATVTVREGEVTLHDFGGGAAGPTSEISGRVTKGGKGAGGAMVILMGSGGMKMATVDQEGDFTFDDVEEGDYTILVQGNMTGGGAMTQKVTVEGGVNLGGVELALSSLQLTGKVLDAITGEPVSFAQIQLRLPGPDTNKITDLLGRFRGQGMTGDDGSFKLSGVPEGVFQLRVSASGHAQAYVDGVSPGGSAIEVRLEPGAAVAVKVLGPAGKPVARVHVTTEDSKGRATSALDMASMGSVTDAEGVTTLKLTPGRYKFTAGGQGHPSATVEADTSSGEVTIRLPASGGVDVVAVDAIGQPVAGARLVLRDGSGAEITPPLDITQIFSAGGGTDASGRLTRLGIPVGKVEAEVTAKGGLSGIATGTVVAGETLVLEVKLR